MAKVNSTQPDDSQRRFTDPVVTKEVKPGQPGGLVIHIDPTSPDYAAGRQARKDGSLRDLSYSINWCAGWDAEEAEQQMREDNQNAH